MARFVGYNWQWDDVVVGLEANYTHASNIFGGVDDGSASPRQRCLIVRRLTYRLRSASIRRRRSRHQDMATFRARAGWSCGDCFLALRLRSVRHCGQCRHFNRWADTTVIRSTRRPRHNTRPLSNVSGPYADGQTRRCKRSCHTAGPAVSASTSCLFGGLFLRGEWEYLRVQLDDERRQYHINTVRAGLGYKF